MSPRNIRQSCKEMQALFLKEAAKYNVLPIDDRGIERIDPSIAGRPDLMGARTSLTLYSGMTGMSENAFLNVKNRSMTITADVDIPQGGANGVLLAQGGRFGGWSLYLKDGKPTYTYNWIGLERYTIAATEPLAAGKATHHARFRLRRWRPWQGRHSDAFGEREECCRRPHRKDHRESHFIR